MERSEEELHNLASNALSLARLQMEEAARLRDGWSSAHDINKHLLDRLQEALGGWTDAALRAQRLEAENRRLYELLAENNIDAEVI